MESFVSLTIQFLTDEMEIIRLVPYTSHFPQRHTGVNIKMKIEKMLEALGLDSNTITKYVCHDNAANCVLGFSLIDDMVQVFCICHTIQLCVRDALKEDVMGVSLSKLIKTSHELAKKVKMSGTMTQELKEACKAVGIKYTKLLPAQVTRWFSTEMNIASLLRVQGGVNYLYERRNVSEWWSNLEISNQGWRLLRAVHTLLQPVKLVSKCFEAETTTTSNLVIPKLYQLKQKFESFEKDESNDR